MGTQNFLWSFAKKYFTFGLIALTVSDRYASVVPIRGVSMSPTFNPHGSTLTGLTDDYVLVEKFCLDKYKFSQGDVVVFCSPSNHKENHIKRITALPGDWISSPYAHDALKVPEGHCWVEGDNFASSLDSRSFGPKLLTKSYRQIPLGLVQGRVTHIVWPPRRVGKVERRIPQDGLPF
ncbi:mitochondrial inner membrane protease subunit 2 isoform X1 [Camellia sinensis]|uniref:mitochondrial inner membrane protease subunit 2 isoform X1 n=1 Tax=Camellia sinensis TaxID=4442 RepID=UPI00103689B8|nr:mitochondrial inner membrane protease subunit 2 isoform X1 [Camellia sinensis]XP_028086656.1 mitochondrial inner membrane protease subunit 2 isoform X1 [Camellia sinensis]XP_028086657.1 mitochondrial inner membrane protease subunit 2 isoform X1 [Camellia sinensis]